MRTQTQKIAILLGIPLLLGAAQDRVAEPIDVGRTAVIGGHVHPKTRLLKDAGPMNPSTPLEVSILMKPLPALDALLAAQQDRR